MDGRTDEWITQEHNVSGGQSGPAAA